MEPAVAIVVVVVAVFVVVVVVSGSVEDEHAATTSAPPISRTRAARLAMPESEGNRLRSGWTRSLSTKHAYISTLDCVTSDLESQVAGVAALHDPIRRSLYLFVAESGDAVGRDRAAEAVGVQRALAAFHLDKLVEEGMLDVEYRRLTGRTGPGAGRPAKLYRRSGRQIDITLPQREYDLAGTLLARAVVTAEASGRSVRRELEGHAFEFGQGIGAEAVSRAGRRPSLAKQRAALLDVLRQHGFEPRPSGSDVVLANCPFHSLAQEFSGLVCGMNLHLMEGVHSRLRVGDQQLRPRLEPEAGRCCVTFCTAPARTR